MRPHRCQRGLHGCSTTLRLVLVEGRHGRRDGVTHPVHKQVAEAEVGHTTSRRGLKHCAHGVSANSSRLVSERRTFERCKAVLEHQPQCRRLEKPTVVSVGAHRLLQRTVTALDLGRPASQSGCTRLEQGQAASMRINAVEHARLCRTAHALYRHARAKRA